MKIIFRLLKESVRFAFGAIRANMLRTILSLLGITIGIFTINLVLTSVDSLKGVIDAQLSFLDDKTIFVSKMPFGPEEGDEEYAWWKYMKRPNPSLKDYRALRENLELTDDVAFRTFAFRTSTYKNNSYSNGAVLAVSNDFEKVITLQVEKGRYISDLELTAGRNVCVLGFGVAEQLFGVNPAVGRTIKVGGRKVDVVGVLQKEGFSLGGEGYDEMVIIPVNFGARLMDFKKSDCAILLKPKSGVEPAAAKNEVVVTLRAERGLRPSQENNFSVSEATIFKNLIDSIFGIINVVGLIIAGFSIVVGGFSIANIMFVSVKERTKIIGVQKSLGAKSSFILLQFLFESVALCVLGGLVGLVFLGLIVIVLNALLEFPIVWSWGNFIFCIGLSIFIGVISGVLPALNASRLSPVEAMRR